MRALESAIRVAESSGLHSIVAVTVRSEGTSMENAFICGVRRIRTAR